MCNINLKKKHSEPFYLLNYYKLYTIIDNLLKRDLLERHYELHWFPAVSFTFFFLFFVILHRNNIFKFLKNKLN